MYHDCAAQHLLNLCAVAPDPVQEPLAIRSQILWDLVKQNSAAQHRSE